MAAEVAGTLFNLVLVAKTKARNEIMKSRKQLDIDGVYGAYFLFPFTDTNILTLIGTGISPRHDDPAYGEGDNYEAYMKDPKNKTWMYAKGQAPANPESAEVQA